MLSLGKDIAAVTETGVTKTTDPDAKRFMGAEVSKSFSDGVFKGKVVGHVPDLDNNELEDGEMFVIQYESGKQETVDSQELMSMLVGAQEEEEEESKEEDPDNLQETKVPDSPKPKPKKKTKEDPLIGRKVQTWMDIDDDQEIQVKGKIVSKSQKTPGKKKGAYYEVEYDDSKLSVEIPNEKGHSPDIKDMLIK